MTTQDERARLLNAFMNSFHVDHKLTRYDRPVTRFAARTPETIYNPPDMVVTRQDSEMGTDSDSVYIKVTLPKWLLDRLDEKAGKGKRAEYIRKLLLADLGIDDDPVQWGGDRSKEPVNES